MAALLQFNRPILSSLVPLFQSESKCETILMKMTLICMKMKLHAELIFRWKVSHLDSFWNRGTTELWNGLLSSVWSFMNNNAKCNRSRISWAASINVTRIIAILPDAHSWLSPPNKSEDEFIDLSIPQAYIGIEDFLKQMNFFVMNFQDKLLL